METQGSPRTEKITSEVYQRNLTKYGNNQTNLGTENTFAELKNSLEALNSRMEQAEERISKLEDCLFENTQRRKKNEKEWTSPTRDRKLPQKTKSENHGCSGGS